jgi:hypothetical protein
MLRLFTLIKREIHDNIIYFILSAILSAIFIIVFLTSIEYLPYTETVSISFILLSIPAFLITIIGFPAMGVTQMYVDKNKKVSAFLSTLPVTRGQILVAKIITALLVMLTLFLPLIITAVILMRFFVPIPIYENMIFDISITVFLMAFACYCIGLLTGWTSNKFTPTFGSIGLTCILIPLILVKGFAVSILVILIVFIIASLFLTWQKFRFTAL